MVSSTCAPTNALRSPKYAACCDPAACCSSPTSPTAARSRPKRYAISTSGPAESPAGCPVRAGNKCSNKPDSATSRSARPSTRSSARPARKRHVPTTSTATRSSPGGRDLAASQHRLAERRLGDGAMSYDELWHPVIRPPPAQHAWRPRTKEHRDRIATEPTTSSDASAGLARGNHPGRRTETHTVAVMVRGQRCPYRVDRTRPRVGLCLVEQRASDTGRQQELDRLVERAAAREKHRRVERRDVDRLEARVGEQSAHVVGVGEREHSRPTRRSRVGERNVFGRGDAGNEQPFVECEVLPAHERQPPLRRQRVRDIREGGDWSVEKHHAEPADCRVKRV